MNQVQETAMRECVAHYNGAAIVQRKRPTIQDAIEAISQWHSECRAEVDNANGSVRAATLITRVNTLATVLSMLEDVAEAGR